MDCCKSRKSIFSFLKKNFIEKKNEERSETKKHKLILVGTPNVGKSVIFNYLTGSYVTVSNYPGTTVEITRGTGKIGEEMYEVIDTPGMYSLIPITEEERVTRTLLLKEDPDLVIHVVDAKNLERMLPLTLQLKEAGLPLMLVVNMMDESERLGRFVDIEKLGKILEIPVAATAAAINRGMTEFKRKVADYGKKRAA